jgi:hypothetical protein
MTEEIPTVIFPPAPSHADTPEDWLVEAGWPEHLIPEALAVAYCESRWHPDSTNGDYRGLFQLATPFWFDYAGEDPERWGDPVVNARTAWKVYLYDLSRGQSAWQQWQCKP